MYLVFSAASKEGPLPAGMGVLLGAAVSLVLLGICALLAAIKARKSRRQRPASTATSVVLGKGLPVPQHDHNPAVIPQEPKRRPPTLLNSSSNDMLTDDRDPDVIPAHYGKFTILSYHLTILNQYFINDIIC